eukprot:TRINITY_DN6866_c0_g1_i1.p1 TRINITY_DN6866_c0_g1~~TRINITY_DN6866_c0_g1_i1.p1  ORF type:complete len:159 (-),score=38.05 TRINITY_DN6866_c0_g1_i1:6-482(-)
MENIAADNIIQPVLQYGQSAAGGQPNQWYIGSWYVGQNSSYHTNLTSVSPGDVLGGVMRLEADIFYIESYVNGELVQSLSMKNLPAPDSIQVVLEAYGITSCRDYPEEPVKYAKFYDMLIADTPDHFINFNWTIWNNLKDCHTTTQCTGTNVCEIKYL